MSMENIKAENDALEAAEEIQAEEIAETAVEAEAAEIAEEAEVAEEAEAMESVAEEEIEEPKIMMFLDEEETTEEEEEEYVPKAVSYQETVGTVEEPKKTLEQMKLEEEIKEESFIRGEIAYMFERKLFAIPSWLSLAFIYAALPVMLTGAFVSKFFDGADIGSDVEINIVGGLLIVAFMQIVLGVLGFVAMRIINTSARNSGHNMTTAGFSMLRAVVLFMCLEPVIIMLSSADAASLSFGIISLVFLLLLLISVHKVRVAVVKAKVKMLSRGLALMFFVMAAMHIVPIYKYTVEVGTSGVDVADSFINVIIFTASAVATVLFGVFVIAYNSHMRKVKEALKA